MPEPTCFPSISSSGQNHQPRIMKVCQPGSTRTERRDKGRLALNFIAHVVVMRNHRKSVPRRARETINSKTPSDILRWPRYAKSARIMSPVRSSIFQPTEEKWSRGDEPSRIDSRDTRFSRRWPRSVLGKLVQAKTTHNFLGRMQFLAVNGLRFTGYHIMR